MTYLVNDLCINCKHMDCVTVCPVDCFYEGENMLVINPDECIDCGVCEPECPADAIVADTAINGTELEFLLKLNTKFSNVWPNITKIRKEDVPEDADQWHGVEGKIKYLSENPGKGD
jgi:ferredoxin